MKNNQKGSALLWSIVVILVLTILVAGSMIIATSYYKRTLVTNNKRQAYLTAKGVIEDVVQNIEASNVEYLKIFSDTSKSTFTPLVSEGNEIPLNIYLKPTDNLGTIKSSSCIRINKVSEDPLNPKGTITIRIVASYNNAEYEVKADMRLGHKDGVDQWQLQKYYQIDTVVEAFNNITTGSKLENEMNYYLKYYNLKKAEFGKNQEKAMIALIEYMKQDESWANVEESVKTELISKKYFNDFTIRQYFASRNENHKFTLFNTDEVRGKDLITVPVAVGDKIEKKEISLVGKNFFKGTYYIQPKYANNYNLSFVFAYTGSEDADKIGIPFNGGSINLVYHDNHWYYIDKIRLSATDTPRDLIPTTFDTTDPIVKWNYLVDNFLTEGNRIQ